MSEAEQRGEQNTTIREVLQKEFADAKVGSAKMLALSDHAKSQNILNNYYETEEVLTEIFSDLDNTDPNKRYNQQQLHRHTVLAGKVESRILNREATIPGYAESSRRLRTASKGVPKNEQQAWAKTLDELRASKIIDESEEVSIQTTERPSVDTLLDQLHMQFDEVTIGDPALIALSDYAVLGMIIREGKRVAHEFRVSENTEKVTLETASNEIDIKEDSQKDDISDREATILGYARASKVLTRLTEEASKDSRSKWYTALIDLRERLITGPIEIS